MVLTLASVSALGARQASVQTLLQRPVWDEAQSLPAFAALIWPPFAPRQPRIDFFHLGRLHQALGLRYTSASHVCVSASPLVLESVGASNGPFTPTCAAECTSTCPGAATLRVRWPAK